LFALLDLHQGILLKDIAELLSALWTEIQPDDILSSLTLGDILHLRDSSSQRTHHNHSVISDLEGCTVELAAERSNPKPAGKHPDIESKTCSPDYCEDEEQPSLHVGGDADESHSIGRHRQRDAVRNQRSENPTYQNRTGADSVERIGIHSGERPASLARRQ